MATSHAQRWRPFWMAEVQAEPPQCVMAGTDNAVDVASAIFQYWQNFWREVDAGRPPLQDQVAAALGGIPDNMPAFQRTCPTAIQLMATAQGSRGTAGAAFTMAAQFLER